MALLLDQFVQYALDSDLVSEKQIRGVLAGLSAADRKSTAALAKALVQAEVLTPFQAKSIYAGRTKLVMGRYVILDKIGSGGMGSVYLARHQTMDRFVALKTLHASAMDSQDSIKRFHQEVRAAARLLHPNIVAAYDAGEERGTHYLVMEYVKGVNLQHLVSDHGPLNVGEAANCVLQVARGLEYAHEQRICHRDIKLSNLLLSQDGVVKILDMGLASLDADSRTATGLTQSGQVCGTIDYMAPEQGLGMKHADHRSDIYSLGCSLFVLLTGRVVFEGETIVNKMMSHRNDRVPSLKRLGAQYGPLDDVFQRMMQKRPEDRYQSMSEVVADLKAFLEGRSTAMILDGDGRLNDSAFVDADSPTLNFESVFSEGPSPTAATFERDVNDEQGTVIREPATVPAGASVTGRGSETVFGRPVGTETMNNAATKPDLGGPAISPSALPASSTPSASEAEPPGPLRLADEHRPGVARPRRKRRGTRLVSLLALGSVVAVIAFGFWAGSPSIDPADVKESAGTTPGKTGQAGPGASAKGRPSVTTAPKVSAGSVPVFILAGQTNMQGAGRVDQLRALIDDPDEGTRYAGLVDEKGQFIERDDVWLVTPARSGPLTVGMGKNEGKFGPALMIGNRLGDLYQKPVVLIRYTHGPWNLAEIGRPPDGQTYLDLLAFVDEVTKDLGKYCPPVSGMQAEVEGFFWLQGWNDLVKPPFAARYEPNLKRFFDAVREHEGRDLPIVFGELGQAGVNIEAPSLQGNLPYKNILEAQRAVARDLDRTVLVGTARFVRPDPPGMPFLYGEDARTFFDIGDAMGRAMVGLLQTTQ